MISECICIKTFYNYNSTVAFHKHVVYKYTDEIFVSKELPKGYNVKFSRGEYFFRKYQDQLADKGYGMFSTYFKTMKDVRKEKLKKLNNTKML